MTDISLTLADLRARIADAERAAGRPPGSVCLVGVGKRHPVDAVREAAAAGLRDFGENFVQEGITKIEALGDRDLVWHFIGHLQGNKTRPVAEHFDWVHSVDRLRIARRLDAQRPHHAPPLQVCLQVLLADEPGKSGVTPEAVPDLADAVAELPRLALRGLMAIPPPATDFDEQRRWFRALAELRDTVNARGHGMDVLSMGMTADLEAAVAEGATHVRIGTALFGPRPPA